MRPIVRFAPLLLFLAFALAACGDAREEELQRLRQQSLEGAALEVKALETSQQGLDANVDLLEQRLAELKTAVMAKQSRIEAASRFASALKRSTTQGPGESPGSYVLRNPAFNTDILLFLAFCMVGIWLLYRLRSQQREEEMTAQIDLVIQRLKQEARQKELQPAASPPPTPPKSAPPPAQKKPPAPKPAAPRAETPPAKTKAPTRVEAKIIETEGPSAKTTAAPKPAPAPKPPTPPPAKTPERTAEPALAKPKPAAPKKVAAKKIDVKKAAAKIAEPDPARLKKVATKKKAAKKKTPRRVPAAKKCKIAGCNGKHRSKGFCNKHYQQWRNGLLDVKPDE